MAFDNLSFNPLNYITYLNIDGVIQDGVSTNRQYLNTYSDTGIISFDGLTMSGSTTINVGACRAWIVNNETDALFPTKTYIEFSGETNIPVTTITGLSENSYVLLTSAATVSFLNSRPTSSQRKENVVLGIVNHPNGIINSVLNKPDFNISPNSQVRDLYKILNLINDGIFVNFNGSNLNLNLNSGVIYGYGINYINDKSNPNVYFVPSGATISFVYRTQSGGTSGYVSSIDPTNYDVGGVITPITGASTDSTIQYIYYIPEIGIGIQYGQTVYTSLSKAVSAIGKESSFVEYLNLETSGILIGMLALTKGATSLDDSSQAIFVRADKFGQPIGVSGGFLSVTDIFTTGLTFNQSNYDLTVSLNNGSAYTQNLSILASDMTITGGSYNPSNGNVTFTNNTGGTFTVSGFTTGMTDTYTTGGTFDNNTDTITFTKNDGGTYSVTGLTDYYTTGTTLLGNTVYFNRNDTLSAYTLDLTPFSVDTYVTGFTYSNNNFTIQQNNGQPDLNVLVNTVTGLTINGDLTVTGNSISNSLSASSISSSTLTVSGITFNKLLTEKVGSVSGSTFTGSPKTYDVIFSSNFSDTNYAISITGPVERSWTYSNQTISGFTINANASTAFGGVVFYIAKSIGEV